MGRNLWQVFFPVSLYCSQTFPHFLVGACVKSREERQRLTGLGGGLPSRLTPHPSAPLPHPTHPLPSSCTPQWRTSSVWLPGSCVSWPRIRRPLMPSTLRGPRPRSWSSCTPAMRAPVRGCAVGKEVAEEGWSWSSSQGGGRRLNWFFLSSPLSHLRGCCPVPYLRGQEPRLP